MKQLLTKTLAMMTCALWLAPAAVLAEPIVHYDFENETVSGQAPEREWAITNKAAPPSLDVTAKEAEGQTLEPFNDGTGLLISPGHQNRGLVLGTGGELDTDYSDGMTIEATFRITGGLKSSQVIVGRYSTVDDNRSFRLYVLADAGDNAREVWFVITSHGAAGGGDVLQSTAKIEEGKTYKVRAIFDPHNDQMSMAIEGVDNDTHDEVSTSTQIDALFVGTAPTVIGGNFDGSINRFHGFIDDVKIDATASQD